MYEDLIYILAVGNGVYEINKKIHEPLRGLLRILMANPYVVIQKILRSVSINVETGRRIFTDCVKVNK